jgi:hypothetical protein
MVMTVEKAILRAKNDIIRSASSYTDDEDVTVTELMFSDLKRTVFAFLPEDIRIKDLEKSPDLQEEMTRLFKDVTPNQPGWPYVEQLEEQDRCYVAVGCTFKPGSGLYKAKDCNHYVCKAHRGETCCTGRTRDTTQDNEKASKQDEDKDSSPASEQPSGRKTTEPQKGPMKGKREIQTEKKRGDDDKPTPKQSSSEPGVGKDTIDEKKKRTPKFAVEDVQYLSVADFEFKRDDQVASLQVCQVRDKEGNMIWMLLDEYVELKSKFAEEKAKEEEEEEVEL